MQSWPAGTRLVTVMMTGQCPLNFQNTCTHAENHKTVNGCNCCYKLKPCVSREANQVQSAGLTCHIVLCIYECEEVPVALETVSSHMSIPSVHVNPYKNST